MEAISLKLDSAMLAEIDRKLSRYRYSTRTEFIRDAIRYKLSELEKKELLAEINRLYGDSKRKTTDKQLHAAGKKAFIALEKRFKT